MSYTDNVVSFERKRETYFKLPTYIFNEELSTTDIAVVACISSFADNYTGESYPSVKVISEKLNVSIRTVRRSIKRLKDKEIIYVENRTRSNGSNSTNLYRVCHK